MTKINCPKVPKWETFWTYETYVSNNIDEHIDLQTEYPLSILLSEPDPDQNYTGIVPVSGLFDRNQYDGNVAPKSYK